MSVKEQIRPAVEGPLDALGLLVEDIAVTPAGKRRLVRVWIDRRLSDESTDTVTATPPLTLDEVADATRVVSEALDEAGAMGEQPYTLEVTSPGVDRHLTMPRHFRRNVSRLVALTLAEGEPVTGRVVRAGQESLTVEVPAARKQPARTVELPYAAVTKAVVQVEFSRPEAEPESTTDTDSDGTDGADTDGTDDTDTDDIDEES